MDQEAKTPQRGRSPGPQASENESGIHFDGSTATGRSSPDSDSIPTSAMTSPLSVDVKAQEDDRQLPKFPSLHTSDNPDETPKQQETEQAAFADVRDAKQAPAYKPIERVGTQKTEKDDNENEVVEDDQTGCIMRKFSLYETASQFYIVGADILDEKFRIIQIDRGAEPGELQIVEDEAIYTKAEMSQLLNKIDHGNKTSGGLKLRCGMWGLLGFIRFTGTYYMLLVTKRSQVAVIGGHYVYQVDGTELIPLNSTLNSRFKQDARNAEEARYLGILSHLDLNRSFYFSYSYDITRTLQHNIIQEREALAKGVPYPHPNDHNSMFVWNNYLLEPASAVLQDTYDWCLPVIHGYIDQAGTSDLDNVDDLGLTRCSSVGIWANHPYNDYCEKI